MDQMNKQQIDQLLLSAPGGVAKLVFDDKLTILYATDAFYTLIKSVSDKLTTKAPISLLRMVYSADIIYVTQQLANQKHRKDNMFDINFRTLQHDGSFKWVMLTGVKTEEVYQLGEKVIPVYSCLAVDITDWMNNYKKLEQSNEYHRIISELSKDLYFEYEIASDTLTLSELYREIFGKDNVLTGFRKRLEKTKVVHQEELPALIGIYNSMMGGRKLARFEIRLIPKDGNPCWYTCYASIIFDENKNPYKVVGKLSTTNHVKEQEKVVHKPALDTLTQVCTKESADVLIKEALAENGEDVLSALMLIDVRNYKNINEIRKLFHGENVLTTIGAVLKSHFRTSDIIGRVGLGGFVVYVRGLPSDKTVYEIADRICRDIAGIYSYEHTKQGLTTSIGITLHRGEQDYQTLLANANTALVLAKKVPTSSFDVYGQTMS